MEYPTLSHHGGTRSVTESCHQLHHDEAASLVIDCGLEQRVGAVLGAELAPISLDIASIKGLIVTHVHPDHVGRTPALLDAGYRGSILCSEPSAKLLPLVLEDAYKLGGRADSVQVDCSHRTGRHLGSAYVECDVRIRVSKPALLSCSRVIRVILGRHAICCCAQCGHLSGQISWCWRVPTATVSSRIAVIGSNALRQLSIVRLRITALFSSLPLVWDEPRSCCAKSKISFIAKPC